MDRTSRRDNNAATGACTPTPALMFSFSHVALILQSLQALKLQSVFFSRVTDFNCNHTMHYHRIFRTFPGAST